MAGFNRTLYELVVAESDHGRAYWAERPWLSEGAKENIRSADVLIVPWVDFRPSHPIPLP
jgi:hypothetical protein